MGKGGEGGEGWGRVGEGGEGLGGVGWGEMDETKAAEFVCIVYAQSERRLGCHKIQSSKSLRYLTNITFGKEWWVERRVVCFNVCLGCALFSNPLDFQPSNLLTH